MHNSGRFWKICHFITVARKLSSFLLFHFFISSFFVEFERSTTFYCPPMRLCEGNVFSHVCPSVSHSVHRRVSHVTITHVALDLTIQEPPPQLYSILPPITPSVQGPHLYRIPLCTRPQFPLPPLMTFGGQDWRPVHTCSLEDSHQCWHLVAIEVHTVSKRAVRILLECFLVGCVII